MKNITEFLESKKEESKEEVCPKCGKKASECECKKEEEKEEKKNDEE